VTRCPNPTVTDRAILVPTVLRGNAVLDAPRRLPAESKRTQSVEDGIPTRERGNEKHSLFAGNQAKRFSRTNTKDFEFNPTGAWKNGRGRDAQPNERGPL